MSIADIKPHGSGSEIKLKVVNWMGVDLTGVEFRVAVAHRNDRNPYILKDPVSIQTLKAGEGDFLTFRVPRKPEKFDAIGITFIGSAGISYNLAR